MTEFLKGAAVLLLALVLSFAAAYVAQDWLGTWLQASEEWAVMPPFLGAWAIVVASTLGLVRCLARTVVALDRAAAVLAGLVLASAAAMFALQVYVDRSLIDQTFVLLLAAVVAPMLLTVAIPWAMLRRHRSASAGPGGAG